MTLIAGIVCDDGVVLAADSASTDLEAQTKQSVNKIKRLGQHLILYAGSGDGGLLQKIEEALEGFPERNSIKRIRQELKARIVPEQAESTRMHAPYPAIGFNKPPEGVLLLAGITNRRPWLIEIEKDGRDTLYDRELGNFAAIGSGKPWAQAIFRPFLFNNRDLQLGKVFAYRVMNDAINLASGLIAAPIRIWTISVEGEIAMVDSDEMNRLQETRELWRQMEQETLGRLLQPQSSPEEAELPPPPS